MNSGSHSKKSTNGCSPKTFDFRRWMAQGNATNTVDANGRNFRPYHDESRYATTSRGPVPREDDAAAERTSNGCGVYAAFEPTVVLQRPKKYAKHEVADIPMMPTGTNATRRTDASYRRSMVKVDAIMDNTTQHTFLDSSGALFGALVEAVDENRSNFWRVADMIVQKVIDNPAKSILYANLCSEAYGLALQQTREGDRDDDAFPDVFKRHLTSACDRVLRWAGVLNHANPVGVEEIGPKVKRRLRQHLEPCEQIIRARTVTTCRFLAHLFVTRRFKLFDVVHKNINTFLRAGDEHSLECLCALLTAISSTIGKTRRSKTDYETYAEPILNRLTMIMLDGLTQESLPFRTMRIINKLIQTQREMSSSDAENNSPSFDHLQPHQNDRDVTEDSIPVDTSIDSEQCTEVPVNVVDSTTELPRKSDEMNMGEASSVRIEDSKIDNSVFDPNGIKKGILKVSASIGERPKTMEKRTMESSAVPETSSPQNDTGTNDPQSPTTTQNDFEFGSNQRLFDCVVFVIDSVTPATISEGAKVFLDVLLEADKRDRSNIDMITDFIVQTAVDRTNMSMMYATFCAEVNKKATEDSRKPVRDSFPRVFKSKLIRSCLRNLARAGLLDPEFGRNTDFEATTNDDRSDGRQNREEVVDADERVRTLGTCRFMGHLYVADVFKMSDVVERTVDALMTRGGDHSLECVCVLLTIAGSKIERESKGFPAKIVYRRLRHLATAGYMHFMLSTRTVRMINALVCLRDRRWTGRVIPNCFRIEHTPKDDDRDSTW